MAFADLLAAADRHPLKHLGGPVSYQPQFGVAVQVTGIFDPRYQRAELVGQAGVLSTAPAVFVLLADLPVDPEADDPVITVGTAQFRVREVEKDGLGGVLIHLKEAS